jgi:sugar phosphate isomerase/epimerase
MIARPPLSAALASLRQDSAADPRAPLEWAASSGFRWATLDAAAPGLRPRELDRSGRRDLASLLRRLELGFAGLDLWIPTAHFVDPALADRAVAAATEAVRLAADLVSLNGGHSVVSLTLPSELPSSTLESLLGHADAHGAVLANHAWPPPDDQTSELLGVGIDPAAVLASGDNPAKAVARLGPRVAIARLSDSSEVGRVEPGAGRGRLNDLSYAVALATAGYDRPLPLDLRAVAEPQAAALRVLRWWGGS